MYLKGEKGGITSSGKLSSKYFLFKTAVFTSSIVFSFFQTFVCINLAKNDLTKPENNHLLPDRKSAIMNFLFVWRCSSLLLLVALKNVLVLQLSKWGDVPIIGRSEIKSCFTSTRMWRGRLKARISGPRRTSLIKSSMTPRGSDTKEFLKTMFGQVQREVKQENFALKIKEHTQINLCFYNWLLNWYDPVWAHTWLWFCPKRWNPFPLTEPMTVNVCVRVSDYLIPIRFGKTDKNKPFPYFFSTWPNLTKHL